MTNYDTKMFREKPYTQCFQCVQGNRLRCKKCMQSLIQNVLQHRYCLEAQETKRKIGTKKMYQLSNTEKVRTSETSHRGSAIQEFEVNTVYGIWMDRMKAKRKKQKDTINIAVQLWPSKISPIKQTIQKIESPKFSTWQSRLLKRFSSFSAQKLGIDIPQKIR